METAEGDCDLDKMTLAQHCPFGAKYVIVQLFI